MVVIQQEENVEPKTTLNSTTSDVNGNDSDGYETASERDVSDNEDEKENNEINAKSEVDSSGNDDESKERALVQAYEAKEEGNKMFGEGRYEEALLKYQLALDDGASSVELRSICHSNRGVCFLKLGKYEDTIKECSKALELNPSYIKALVRRAEAHEKLDNFEGAIADTKKILELDPSNDQATKAIRRLEPLAEEKREKMKEEMIGKLKEMGNSILGRFGMSIDNFKAVKDPNTGSYSINFQR